ncbi:MAG TPA: glycosyl hydrolase [Candidatus Brocadiia bacterium]|nr:glycosyl hydrolase [Candidatus Brocadiia bacterium]
MTFGARLHCDRLRLSHLTILVSVLAVTGCVSENMQLKKQFLDPPKEFSPMPFWFWNGDLTPEGIRTQMAAFREKGVWGFVIHPRMGLSPSIPYLSDKFMELVVVAVEDAAEHGMIVHLYDEGMYPSGSSHGMIVKENPNLASRCLELRRHACPSGESKVSIEIKEGERFVSACAAAMADKDSIVPDSMLQLPARDGVIEIARKDDGREWAMFVFVDSPSNGTIRGVHLGEDDGQPGAPKSADLLNPETTAAFIRLTHERYYQALKGYFGTTVRAMFTDEPSPRGRGGKRGVQDWTAALPDAFRKARGYDVRPLLPALWYDVGPKTAQVRRDYRLTIEEMLGANYYAPLSEWCAKRGISLTGHPASSMGIGHLGYFQLPGQDIVWRWVVPEGREALEGENSACAKCSSSAARQMGAPRNGNECFGAYGWRFTPDEMKWLSDWLLVRGVNLLWPHAFYYSIEGSRAMERPPCVGPNNLWWPHYRLFADYTRRMSWVASGACRPRIAVLGRRDWLPWKTAKVLYETQRDFDYIEERILVEKSSVEKGRLLVGPQRYSAVLIEGGEGWRSDALDRLAECARSGLRVCALIEDRPPSNDTDVVVSPEALSAWLDGNVIADVSITPHAPALRAATYLHSDAVLIMLVNEGEQAIEGDLTVPHVGVPEWWDAWTGQCSPAPVVEAGRNSMILPFNLERRQSLILAVRPGKPPVVCERQSGEAAAASRAHADEACRVGSSEAEPTNNDVGLRKGSSEAKPAEKTPARASACAKPSALHTLQIHRQSAEIRQTWRVVNPAKNDLEIWKFLPELGNWSDWPSMKKFSGALSYQTHFNPAALGAPLDATAVELDLGRVCDFAVLKVNGKDLGPRLWAPYRWDITGLLKPGENAIEVLVTNSRANEFENEIRPSGLMGPVEIRWK